MYLILLGWLITNSSGMSHTLFQHIRVHEKPSFVTSPKGHHYYKKGQLKLNNGELYVAYFSKGHCVEIHQYMFFAYLEM